LRGGLLVTGSDTRREGGHLRRERPGVEEVHRYAVAHPEAEWIVGARYDATLSPDGMVDARWLNAVVPDRPVALRSWDYHTLWCNTEAMNRAGLSAATPDTARGTFARRADGELLSMMVEWDAVDAVLGAAPPRITENLVQALRIATEAYAAAGVT
jgi:predicted amidohydrolase YtcJ